MSLKLVEADVDRENDATSPTGHVVRAAEMDVVDGLWRTSQGESGDEILQLLLGRLDLGGALRDGRGQSADRRFGFTKLIEGLLVQRGIMSDRGQTGRLDSNLAADNRATEFFNSIHPPETPRGRVGQ